MSNPARSSFLLADIGGTNTRVALSDGLSLIPDSIRRYKNAENERLDTVLDAYLTAHGIPTIDAVCVDVAGPVQGDRARLTNLDWDISTQAISQVAGTRNVAIVNDLEAQGYAIEHIDAADLAEVRKGQSADAKAPKLVVNIGTGFNATAVFNTSDGWFVAKSESGHANMPARTPADVRLCAFIEETYGFAAIDDVLSGRGLVRVYEWLAHEAGQQSSPSSTDIIEGCRTGADPLAVETVACFTRLLALVTGNLALTQLPFGGIYMVGGLSGAILPFMEQFEFEKAFVDKGRFSGFMDAFPVHVVQDDYAALKGCAAYLTSNTL